ncbi:hypothetical protein RhiJN_27054 [Ceratobasidium sp. AG-Ba]|nr:hypothetical protein RhiJN_27054 [Ceratobasidium sp. AG-Ba]
MLDGMQLRKSNFSDEWEEVAVVETLQLPRWFEHQKNDYLLKQYHETRAVEFDWIDLPADDSKDVRARRFNIQKGPLSPTSSGKRSVQVKQLSGVLVIHVPEPSRDDSKAVDAEDFDVSDLEDCGELAEKAHASVPMKPKKRGRPRNSASDVQKCPVLIYLEIHAHDVKNVHIWMKHNHKDAPDGVLTWSRRIYAQAVNLSRNEGATAAQVMKSLLPHLQIQEGPNVIPPYRRPTAEDIENIMPASRRRQHYAKNAFASLSLFAEQNPGRVFLYQPYKEDGSSKLMCAVTNNFCLGSSLLYGQSNGLFMDATWRGMNQNFAPTTFLLGVDKNMRATLLAVLLSQDVKADTLELFLNGWKKKLRTYAGKINAGAIPEDRDQEEIEKIKAAASQVIAGTWLPNFVMIDKDRAERKASKRAFPNVPVRVCQFHAVDAILRWLHGSHTYNQDNNASKQSKSKNTFKVPEEAHSDILRLFRYTQRCREAEEFDTYLDAFESGLKKICMDYSIGKQFHTICDYFKQNFWCPEWRDSVTDIGLPVGHTRDKILNTNNHAESFIKTFKHTMLGMRQNKRVDTLVIIIADILLPFYQIWRRDRIRHTKQHIETSHGGYQIWSSGRVKTTGMESQFQVDDLAGHKARRFRVTWGSSVNPSCSCTAFGQTGKMCQHLWAVKLFSTHGNIYSWAETTNVRLSDKAFSVKDLYRHQVTLPEEAIPIDDKFPELVSQWDEKGQNLASANYEDILPEAKSSSTGSPLASPQGSPPQMHNPKPSKSKSSFTAVAGGVAGRPRKPSPIRSNRKKTYSNAVSGVIQPSLAHQALTDQVVFRKTRSGTTRQNTMSAKSPMLLEHAPTPSKPPNLYDNLDMEDFLLRQSNFNSWDDDWYQLRIEEADLVSEMLNQLGLTLGLGTFVLADQGQNLKHFLDEIDTATEMKRRDTLASLDSTYLLAQILQKAPDPQSLRHLLILQLKHSHWMLIDFQLENQVICTIDSLPEYHSHHPDIHALHDYIKLVDILSDTCGRHDLTAANWSLQNVSSGHQPINSRTQAVANLSCGFWASTYAILAMMDTPIRSNMSLLQVKDLMKTMLVDYKTNNLGGLTKDMVIGCLNKLIPNIHGRYAHAEHLDVWAPRIVDDKGDSTFMLVQEDDSMETASVEDNITSIQHQLAPISVLDEVNCIFIPFNEPITSAGNMPSAASKGKHPKSGYHWAAIMIKPKLRTVTYKSSLLDREAGYAAIELIKTYLNAMGEHRKSDRGKYTQSLWSFDIAEDTPQQSNSHECGIHVISYLLECLLGQEVNWSDWQYAVLRSRLAIQILEGELALNSLLEDSALLDLSQTHAYYTAITPGKKRHQSRTPSLSPEITMKQKGSSTLHPSTKKLHTAKRPKIAPFPLNPSFNLLKQQQSINVTSNLNDAHIEEIMNYKPQSSSSSPVAHSNHDPDAKCPFCDWPVPKQFQTAFNFKLDGYLSSSITDKRKNNERARRAKPGHVLHIQEFCHWHELGSKWQTWSQFNWPMIDQKVLPERVSSLLPLLQEICSTPEESYAFQVASKFWSSHPRGYVVGAKGMFEAAQQLGLSYYGGEGNTIMFQIVRQALDDGILVVDLKDCTPINDLNFFLYNVLIPEVLINLVMEDMGLAYDEALEVLEESKEYGQAGFSRLATEE